MDEGPAHIAHELNQPLAALRTLSANALAFTYKWNVTGSAGGTLFDPVLGSYVTALTTAQPTA